MKRETALAAFGILVALAPFLGLPYSWLRIALPVLGLLILALALIGRFRASREALSHAEAA